MRALGAMLRRRGRWVPLAFLAPLLLNVLYWIKTHGMVSDTDPLGFDLLSFRVAERALASGQCPYHRGVVDGVYPFANPPFFALFVSPLRSLGHWTALALWTSLALVGMGASLPFLTIAPRARLRVALVVLLSPAAFFMLRAGQSTWLSLLCVSLAWWLHQKGRHAFAGVALGILAIRPQWAVPLMLIWGLLLPKGRLTLWVSAAATSLALLGVGEWAFPGSFACYGRFLRDMRGDFAGWAGFSYPDATALWGNLLAWVPRGPATAIYLIVAVGLFVWLYRCARAATEHARFALVTLYCLLVSPHSSGYDWLLLLPVFCALWVALPAQKSQIVGWAAITMLVCYASPNLVRVQVETLGNGINPSWPTLVLLFVSACRWLRPTHEARPV